MKPTSNFCYGFPFLVFYIFNLSVFTLIQILFYYFFIKSSLDVPPSAVPERYFDT